MSCASDSSYWSRIRSMDVASNSSVGVSIWGLCGVGAFSGRSVAGAYWVKVRETPVLVCFRVWLYEN